MAEEPLAILPKPAILSDPARNVFAVPLFSRGGLVSRFQGLLGLLAWKRFGGTLDRHFDNAC